MKKLLLSSILEDVYLGVEILSKKPSKYVKQVVRDINGGKLHPGRQKYDDFEEKSTYSFKINYKTDSDENIYITNKGYYCSVNGPYVYIDTPKRANKRILEGHSILAENLVVSLTNES